MTASTPTPTPTPDARILRLTADELDGPAPVVFDADVYRRIAETVGRRPAESGGMLGGRRLSSTVEEFYFDESGSTTGVTYYPDMQVVNDTLREDWNPRGVNLLGFVHSHPRGSTQPSLPDRAYSERILTAIPAMGRMILPIAQSSADTGRFSLHTWTVDRRDGGFVPTAAPVSVRRRALPIDPTQWREFDRVRDAYDLRAMASSRVVVVGCGGSAQFVEDLARAGVGEFVLIDPDVVEPQNLGTQHYSRDDVGRPKADALARRIVGVSPYARVTTVQARIEELDDAAMARLANAPFAGRTYAVPSTTLLCAFTDAFEPQARIARLGLHLALPVVSATVYEQGRGAEITFTLPGVTPACIRCALSSRYRAYLDEGYTNEVTSHGTPLWATARLNAAKTPIALALLHRSSRDADPSHPATARYAELLDWCGDRNLLLLGMAPDAGERLGMPPFDQASNSEVGLSPADLLLWRRPTPDRPELGAPACPDCGGEGDLSEREGRFADTRFMPQVFGEGAFPEALVPVAPRGQAAVTGRRRSPARLIVPTLPFDPWAIAGAVGRLLHGRRESQD